MALEPVLFPDLVSPEFVRSSEVAEVADRVLDRHGRAGGIGSLKTVRASLVDGQISGAYLLNTKPFDPTKDSVTHDEIAKCVKAPAMWHDVTGFDFAIWVRSYFWNQFDERARAGVLLHWLLHLIVDADEEGTVKIRLAKHDVEEFIPVVRHYGSYLPGREALVRAYGLWQDDGGDPAKPRAVRSRPPGVAGEISDAVFDRVVDIVEDAGIPLRDDDDVDVRPAGAVNTDALRGDVDRAIGPDDL